MRTKTFFLALVLSTLCSVAEKPNVLFIAVDDLNDWAGYRGTEQAVTPNMDRLAEQGTWFSNAYCQYPLCGPSRASVMSGVYYHQLKPDQLQVKDKFVEKQAEAMGSKLLHAVFKEHGYKTMAVGKILHHYLPKKNLDVSGGRDNWDFNEDKNGNRIRSNWPPDLNPATAKTLTDWGVYVGKNGAGTEADMSDSRTAEWAVARLREKHDKPFMLMVGFLHPHVPWYVPQKYFDMIDPEKIVLPPYRADDLDDVPAAGHKTINEGYPRTEWAIKNDQWRNIVHAYLANIAFADAKIGQVLDALESSPYGDNTIVVLWSDHGYHMGEKNTFQKHTLWNRSAEAPLMIRVPESMRKQLKPGRCDRVVGMIDIYPTLLDLCNLPANEVVEGRSLQPLLKNPDAEWDYPAFTFGKSGGKSLRYGSYRYIQYGDGSMELYDLELDPNEWTNLAQDPAYEATIRKLSALFDTYKTDEEKL
jgi:arylsulfatase A-like enzyme